MKRKLRLPVVVFALVVAACAAGALTVSASGEKDRARAERALKEGEFVEAERLYREMVVKDAHDEQARLGLGLALLKQRKNQDAYDQAARVLAADPTNARAHSLLGSALLTAADRRASPAFGAQPSSTRTSRTTSSTSDRWPRATSATPRPPTPTTSSFGSRRAPTKTGARARAAAQT